MKTFLALLLPSLLCAPTLDLPALWPVPAFAIRLPITQTGMASYYGRSFQGRLMKNGETYDQRRLTLASNDIPLGTMLRICRADRESRCVDSVTVTDTGELYGRLADTSREVMRRLGGLTQGVIPVRIEVL